MNALYVGIDVCKAHLDCSLRRDGAKDGAPARFLNTTEGIEALTSSLLDQQVRLVVLEATGGLEAVLVSALLAASIPVAVVNPRQVRDFAKALGQLAKTDAIDAAVLAHFAEAVRPLACFVGEEDTRHLKELMTRRRQLREMITAESHRLTTASSTVRPNIERSLGYLNGATSTGLPQDAVRRNRRRSGHFHPEQLAVPGKRATSAFGAGCGPRHGVHAAGRSA